MKKLLPILITIYFYLTYISAYSQNPDGTGWFVAAGDSTEVTWSFTDNSTIQNLDISLVPCQGLFYRISFPGQSAEVQKNLVMEFNSALVEAGIVQENIYQEETMGIEGFSWHLRLCDETGNFNVLISLINK